MYVCMCVYIYIYIYIYITKNSLLFCCRSYRVNILNYSVLKKIFGPFTTRSWKEAFLGSPCLSQCVKVGKAERIFMYFGGVLVTLLTHSTFVWSHIKLITSQEPQRPFLCAQLAEYLSGRKTFGTKFKRKLNSHFMSKTVCPQILVFSKLLYKS
jgi:hypothetical protein